MKCVPRRRRPQSGFTLIELLIVVAIIGLVGAIAAPMYARMTKRAKRVALASEAKTVHTAMQAYYADHNKYPSAWFGPDKLNMATLAPLTTEGYLSPRTAESFISKQEGGQLFIYFSWWVGGEDTEFWMFVQPIYDPNEWIYIWDTSWAWSSYLDGVYFWDNGYKKVDQMKDL